MTKRKLRICISSCLILGFLLTGCSGTETRSTSNPESVQASVTEYAEESVATSSEASDYSNGIEDENAIGQICTEGITDVVINSHNIEEVSSSEFGEKYVACDTINATYNAGDMTGILPQTVSKDYEFYFNKETSEWELLKDTTTACAVDNNALPGSSWKCNSIDTDSLKKLFGDDIQSAEDGELYFRFLKRAGLFSFNLSNEKNTSSERFFTTIETSGKLNLVSSDGVIEKSFNITSGSVTDSGIYTMDISCGSSSVSMAFGTDVVPVTEQEYDQAIGLEVDENKVYLDTLTRFDVTTTSTNDGEWKTEIGLKEKNLSPELTWEAVDGATKYAILMIDDTTANNWLHWFSIVDKTHIDEGEFNDSKTDYAGPYPPETHQYDVYVIALADDPGSIFAKLDTPGGDIHSRLNDLNTKSDGSIGNVLAYGLIEADYTPASDYYGDR